LRNPYPIIPNPVVQLYGLNEPQSLLPASKPLPFSLLEFWHGRMDADTLHWEMVVVI